MRIVLATIICLQQAPVRQTRVEVVTPAPPIPVAADGKRVLAYELHVTNFGSTPLTLERIEIFGNGTPLATYGDGSLVAILQRVGANGDATHIDPGQRVIAFLWIGLAIGTPLPATLRHRLSFGESTIDSLMVPVRDEAVPVLSPPVRGGEWLAGNAASNTSDHRRSVVPLNGRARISQRFAIDWVEVGKNGNTFHDDPHKNGNFWAYGTPVLAVADGEVTDLIDSITDNVPRSPLPPVTIANIAGNYVIVRIASHRYVMFAHLQRGSVRVHLHQHVHGGDVLGLIGNSGQATGPHLHMQMMDDNSPLASEGVPFVFDAYTFLGNGSDFDEGHHASIPRRREMPTENQVVGFP